MDTKFDFISNGDGTCYVSRIGIYTDNDITVPSISPSGDTVTRIGDYAFINCDRLTSITIPSSVRSIGMEAFIFCSSLTSITIPDSVTEIGRYAFSCCTGLTSITIPNSVTSIKMGVFAGCSSLTSITIPSSVTSIGEDAFGDCLSLTSITIPSSVTKIGDLAFEYCRSLTSITIPSGMTSIGGYAFYRCESLKKYTHRRFKAADGAMRCRNYQYEMGTWYETPEAQLCETGFHSCVSPLDVLNYYNGDIGEDVRFFEVETQEESPDHNDDSKRVSKRIRFIKELTLSDLAELASNS